MTLALEIAAKEEFIKSQKVKKNKKRFKKKKKKIERDQAVTSSEAPVILRSGMKKVGNALRIENMDLERLFFSSVPRGETKQKHILRDVTVLFFVVWIFFSFRRVIVTRNHDGE